MEKGLSFNKCVGKAGRPCAKTLTHTSHLIPLPPQIKKDPRLKCKMQNF